MKKFYSNQINKNLSNIPKLKLHIYFQLSKVSAGPTLPGRPKISPFLFLVDFLNTGCSFTDEISVVNTLGLG